MEASLSVGVKPSELARDCDRSAERGLLERDRPGDLGVCRAW